MEIKNWKSKINIFIFFIGWESKNIFQKNFLFFIRWWFSRFDGLIAAARDESALFGGRENFRPTVLISLKCTRRSSGCEMSAAPIVETFSSASITWHADDGDVRTTGTRETTIGRPTNLVTFHVIPHPSRNVDHKNGRNDQENGHTKFHPKIK